LPYQLIIDAQIAFEQRFLFERHYILELAWWLIEERPRKINEAIKYKKYAHITSAKICRV
jgi:hypothetical protein